MYPSAAELYTGLQVFDYVDVNGGVDGARQGTALPTIRQGIGERDARYLRGFPNVMVESDSLPTIPWIRRIVGPRILLTCF
jgi:hypothetical protein